MQNMFFDDWSSLLRAFVITVCGYIALIVAIRISGKRTLAKMNAFDFVVTIALGSCLAALSLNKNIALAEGVLVFATLIGLQFCITFLAVRISKVKEIVSGRPELLFFKGKPLEHVMKKERITHEEICVAARSQGITTLSEVEAIILETTGDLTVLSKIKSGPPEDDAMHNVWKKYNTENEAVYI